MGSVPECWSVFWDSCFSCVVAEACASSEVEACVVCCGLVALGLVVVVFTSVLLSCVENLLCTSTSVKFLCLVYERKGWRGKSCDRVLSL